MLFRGAGGNCLLLVASLVVRPFRDASLSRRRAVDAPATASFSDLFLAFVFLPYACRRPLPPRKTGTSTSPHRTTPALPASFAAAAKTRRHADPILPCSPSRRSTRCASPRAEPASARPSRRKGWSLSSTRRSRPAAGARAPTARRWWGRRRRRCTGAGAVAVPAGGLGRPGGCCRALRRPGCSRSLPPGGAGRGCSTAPAFRFSGERASERRRWF